MTAKTIYIFRHGQTDYNAQRRVMGRLDIPLNDTGIAQATELANKLATESIQVIYSSPLARAMQTAQIVADKTGANVISDDSLMERNMGCLSGHIVTMTEKPSEYQTDFRRRHLCLPAELLNNPDWRPNGGESRTESFHRAQQAIMKITKNSPFDTIAISTHGGVIWGILDIVGAADRPLGNCDYVKLTFDGNKLQH